MLQSQALYGLAPAIAEDGPVAVGRSLYATLPEDVYDRGPQCISSRLLVADVRLDNRRDLGRALNLQASQLEQICDSELLLKSLLEWGEQAVDRLVGEFAFAFWNAVRREFLLARDFLGLRPLYYHRSKSFFAFASMPSGLHALPEVPYDFDPDFIAQSLAFLPRRGSTTYFREIQRVEPGCLVRVDGHGTHSQSYWNPPRPSSTVVRSPQDYGEGLRELFDQAVAAQLRGAHTKVATHLSAGLDSSSVTATAARLIPDGRVTAFTAAPRGGFVGKVPAGIIANEAEFAARTAALYPNIEHVVIDSGDRSPIDRLDRDFYYQQQPAENLCNAVWGRAIYRSAKERGLTTLLYGSMGNMSFSYSGLEWLPYLLRTGQIATLARVAAGLLRSRMPMSSLGARVVGPFLPKPLWQLLTKLAGRVKEPALRSAVNPAAVAGMLDLARERSFDFAGRPRSDPFETRRWVYSRCDSANYSKAVLAEWGISLRDPTGDKRVIEYCLSVPYEEFLRGGVPRSLARRAFADRLPAAVAGLQMRGYQAADWYEGLCRDRSRLAEEVASIARCGDAGAALDSGWLEEAVRDWPEGGWDQPAVIARYRMGLLRGVSAGHFMRKVRGTN